MDPKLELMEAILEALAGTLNARQVELVRCALRSCGDAIQRFDESADAYVGGLVGRLLLLEADF